jgi:hypothetical protein
MNRKTIDSFKIYVTDSQGEKLAIIENGVTYTAKSGTVQNWKTANSVPYPNMLT